MDISLKKYQLVLILQIIHFRSQLLFHRQQIFLFRFFTLITFKEASLEYLTMILNISPKNMHGNTNLLFHELSLSNQ